MKKKLLEQLDFIRLSLPEAFQEAILTIQQKEEILLEAEAYGTANGRSSTSQKGRKC